MPGSRPAKKPSTPKKAAPTAGLSSRAKKIARLLGEAYPDARCMLGHESPFQLLIATILAAQCTDKLVNTVTPALFKKFKNALPFPSPLLLKSAEK